MPGKYGFHCTLPAELIEDLGREWAEDYTRKRFQEHLDIQELHRVEGAAGEIRIVWPAFPMRSDPPKRNVWQWLCDNIRRRPKPQPFVYWPIAGYTRVQEDDPSAIASHNDE